MKSVHWTLGAAMLLVGGGATLIQGQIFRHPFFSSNRPPQTELVIARWQYTGRGKFGGTGWSHNYPSSDQHLAQVLSEATNIDVKNVSFRIVELGSPEVFDYPFAVVSEPGEMALTPGEVEHLREYIDRGGFVLLDDFDGPRDLAILERDFHRAFPDRDFALPSSAVLSRGGVAAPLIKCSRSFVAQTGWCWSKARSHRIN
jgi:hypothetical protein